MKKLMVAIAAAATAFGLYAADDGFKSGTGFDAMTVGAKTPTELTTDDTATWSTSDSAATLEVKAWVSSEKLDEDYRPAYYSESIQQVNYLNVKTALDKPLTRAYEQATSLASADFYVDTLVKFTACDEEITTLGDDAAKIAVWVKETEAEGNKAGTTNLMITAGYITAADGSVRQENYDCGKFDGVDAWHRLTIKAIGDISKAQNGLVGFVVFIDGNATGDAVFSAGAKGYADYKTILSDVATLWDNKGQLFPSLKGTEARSISALAVAGQGGIDDIAFTTTAPTWATKSAATITWDANVEYVVVTDGDNVSTNYTSPKAVESGKAYTIEAKAKSGYALNTFTSPWTPDADATLEITTVAAAAEFDGIGYATFAEALAAAKAATASGVLKLFANQSAIQWTSANASQTIDLNGNTVNMLQIVNGSITVIDSGTAGTVSAVGTAVGSTLTIKDGKFVNMASVSGTLVIPSDSTAEFFTEGQIADVADLKKLALVVNAGWATAGKTFKQTADITLTAAWAGIGTYTKGAPGATDTYFAGVYDGQGHAINGLTFTTGGNQMGLFRKVYGENAEVKDLTVNVDFVTDIDESGAAAVVGVLSGGKITRVTANGAIKATHACSGIAGMVNGNAVFTDVTNNVDVIGYKIKGGAKAGGMCNIVQANSISGTPKFIRCVNNGDIAGKSPSNGVGGIVGYLAMSIEVQDCELYGSYASTEGAGNVGSIFGIKKDDGSVTMKGTNKVVAGTITGDASFDGLNYATVDGEVVTLVANAAVVKGNTYKVMTAGNAPTFELGKDETIAFNIALAEIVETGITAASGLNLKIDKTTTPNVWAYSTEAGGVEPVNPGEQKTYPDANSATNAATAFNGLTDAQKAAAMTVPAAAGDTDAEKAAYAGLFSATVAADGLTVIYDLSDTAKTAIVDEMNASEASILAPNQDGKATITAKPGLWYGIKGVGALESIGAAAGQNWTQATTTSVEVAVPEVKGDKAFFQPVCSAVEKK